MVLAFIVMIPSPRFTIVNGISEATFIIFQKLSSPDAISIQLPILINNKD